MATSLFRHWWLVLVRGIAAILFGVLTFMNPGISLFALVLLFGAYAIVDGVSNIVFAVRAGREGRRWGWLVFEGIVGIAAGLVAFFWPGITATALLLVIAFWAIFTGISEIAAAVRLRKVVQHEWLMGLAGVLSIAFGILLLARPSSGALAVVLLIGAYAIVFGVLLLGVAFRLRSLGRHPERAMPAGRFQPQA